MLILLRREYYAKIASDAISGILSPLSMENPPYGQLPKAIFKDAYVLGFLQVFAFAVIEEIRGTPIRSCYQLRIFSRAIKHISPKSAKKLPRLLAEYDHEDHRYYHSLNLGRLEATAYVQALMNEDDKNIRRYIEHFYDTIRTRYLREDAAMEAQY